MMENTAIPAYRLVQKLTMLIMMASLEMWDETNTQFSVLKCGAEWTGLYLLEYVTKYCQLCQSKNFYNWGIAAFIFWVSLMVLYGSRTPSYGLLKA